LVEVVRLRGLDPAEFRSRFEDALQPVVIEGGCAELPAVQKWSLAYLKEKFGKLEVPHHISATHQHPNFHAATLKEVFAGGTSSFSELLDLMTTGEPAERARRFFAGDQRFLWQRRRGVEKTDEALAPLLDDVPLPAYVPAERMYTIWGWFSGRGVRTWLHYDNNGCHNVNAQLTGEKTCVLYPPEALALLRPFLLGGGNPVTNCSEIDVEDPAAQELLRSAHGIEATLRPGDLLFMPAWWFHAFLHVGEFNSNVNFWWKPEPAQLNSVAVRQGFLDAVAASGIDSRVSSPHAALLAQLDQALVAAR
jgi:hypothetical protein